MKKTITIKINNERRTIPFNFAVSSALTAKETKDIKQGFKALFDAYNNALPLNILPSDRDEYIIDAAPDTDILSKEKKVLVYHEIDDETRKIMASLIPLCYHIQAEYNSDDFLSSVSKVEPDIIISDFANCEVDAVKASENFENILVLVYQNREFYRKIENFINASFVSSYDQRWHSLIEESTQKWIDSIVSELIEIFSTVPEIAYHTTGLPQNPTGISCSGIILLKIFPQIFRMRLSTLNILNAVPKLISALENNWPGYKVVLTYSHLIIKHQTISE